MSWNDFLSTVQQDVSSATDIYSHIRSTVTGEPLVVNGQMPTGNLSAAQIAAGQTGATSGIRPANNGFLSMAGNAFGFNSLGAKSMMPLLLVGGVVLFFVLRKRR